MTLRLAIDPLHPSDQDIAQAAEVLRQGDVLAYPTETLYGLGVDPFHDAAMEKLYELKGRPEKMPVSLLVKDVAMLETLVHKVSLSARRLIDAFLPGPLTIVLDGRDGLSPRLTAGTGKIGIRISSYPLLPHLFARFPAPITTTSANLAGRPPARNPRQILDYFPKGIACLLDTGDTAGSVGSTVVDGTGDQPVIIREGAITAAEISAAWTS